MITGIVLENFKCFERVEIHPKRITCFVGANGTGKSSVLQAFGLLKQTVEPLSGSQVQKTMANGGDLTLQGPFINVSEPWDLCLNPEDVHSQIAFRGKQDFIGPESPYSYPARFTLNRFSVSPLVDSDSVTGAFLVLKRLRIIPALRGLTRPDYSLGNKFAADISLEEDFSKLESQTASNLAYSREDLRKVSKLLESVTRVGLRADLVPPKSVQVKSVTESNSFNVVLEGFGTNSLIMLLLQLTSAEKGATIMIEEPEIHLHPKAQAELAEVLTEVALEEDKQVIMTTHSEHITGRLLTLVAEGKLTPDDVAIYAFEKDEAGVCTAKDLRITDDGRVEGSIGDFFEVNLAEMNRMVKALSNRTDKAG